jgi:hypothetical protein
VQAGGFVLYHVFEDVTVAVENQYHLIRWHGSRNPPRMQVVSRVQWDSQILEPKADVCGSLLVEDLWGWKEKPGLVD